MGITEDIFDEYGNYKYPDYLNTQYINYATATGGKIGMPIDDTCEPKSMSKEEIVETLKTMVFGVQAFDRFNAKERETLDKAWNIIDQYENRLKSDMVAMLIELQLEIEELDSGAGYDGNGMPTFSTDYIRKKKVNELIQQKINSLKEKKND